MTTAAGTDLGPCGAFISGGRCDGRLIVEGELGAMLEAVCDRCGDVAARPLVRLREAEPVPVSQGEQMPF